MPLGALIPRRTNALVGWKDREGRREKEGGSRNVILYMEDVTTQMKRQWYSAAEKCHSFEKSWHDTRHLVLS